MKLASLISENMVLLPVLERLGIGLGFGEATLSEVCAASGVSESLFEAIAGIYMDRNYVPSLKALGREDIPHILDYLHRSHEFYTCTWFPNLHTHLHAFLQECDELNREVVNKFYDEYDAEVEKHFRYEEETVFPYVRSVLAGDIPDGFNIKDFEKNHTNIDIKLKDLKSILLKYLPGQFSTRARFDLLAEISFVETDHERHTKVEDYLLIPLVERMEAGYGKKK